jgi:hypothetical protein
MQRIPDFLQDCVGVFQHFIVPKTQHSKSFCFQCPSTLHVVLGLIRFGMLTAVQFNAKPGLVAVKVEDVFADRVLPPEFPSVKLAVAE